MVIFAKPILLLYAGRNFLDSIHNFRILMVARVVFTLSSMIAPYYVKAGALGLHHCSAILLGIVSISLNILLVTTICELWELLFQRPSLALLGFVLP